MQTFLRNFTYGVFFLLLTYSVNYGTQSVLYNADTGVPISASGTLTPQTGTTTFNLMLNSGTAAYSDTSIVNTLHTDVRTLNIVIGTQTDDMTGSINIVLSSSETILNIKNQTNNKLLAYTISGAFSSTINFESQGTVSLQPTPLAGGAYIVNFKESSTLTAANEALGWSYHVDQGKTLTISGGVFTDGFTAPYATIATTGNSTIPIKN